MTKPKKNPADVSAARQAPAHMAPAHDSAADAARYAALLVESRKIKGVSLWQDAWRRLKKNWAAMLSLYFLIMVALLALLTPILPLQSPIDKDLQDRQFKKPNLQKYEIGKRPGLKFQDGSLVAALRKYDADVRQLREQTRDADREVHESLANELACDQRLRQASPEAADAIAGELATLEKLRLEKVKQREGLQNKLADLLRQHPFEQLWSKPGAVTRAMIRCRLAVFRDWCIPSLCGTDALGRDILARVFGARVSLIVGLVATLVSLLIGVSYGATAGYLGGRADNLMMRFVDILYSIPFIFVVIFIITILKAEETKAWMEEHGINQIMIFYVIIGAIYWLTMSRVVRGQVISLKNEQFIDAARTIGASQSRIIFRHLIPNVMGIVIVYLSLTIPAVMLFEAFLSFLGLGVEAPDVSWGLLVNEGIQAITPIRTFWWLVLFPGLTLTLTLFALNFLGDGLRDALDPKLENR